MHIITVFDIQYKPPNSDHIGSELFGHCSEVGLISEVVFQIQYNV